jgi:hypothetical protein
MDCSYLVTAWTQGEGAEEIKQEHQLLSAVMVILLRYPKLPANVLQGSLQNQEPPLRALAARPANLQSLGEFWQAVGKKPKATLHYTVTVSVPVHVQTLEVPLVAEILTGSVE